MYLEEFKAFFSHTFNIFGSDKSSKHSYEDAYCELLFNKKIGSILEIGILNELNLEFESSLIAWKVIYPNADIYAIDIDENKVNEAVARGFNVFVVDQSSKESLLNFSEIIKDNKFDLIVDDGSHVFSDAQITFEILLDHLSDEGIYCIEDIAKIPLEQNGGQQTLNDWQTYLRGVPNIEYKIIDTMPHNTYHDDSIVIGVWKRV